MWGIGGQTKGQYCGTMRGAVRVGQTHEPSRSIPIFTQWLRDAVIWDGASAHGSKVMGEVAFERISLPSYSPELNLDERVFEWWRGKIEGEVYASLQHKRYEINRLLRQLNADKLRLQQLIGWRGS